MKEKQTKNSGEKAMAKILGQKRTIVESTIEALGKLLNYCYHDEERHCEGGHKDDRAGHIFQSIKKLDEWMFSDGVSP